MQILPLSQHPDSPVFQAAVIREREHGTLEHLLVMPVTSGEIMLAKVWANGLVIVLSAVLFRFRATLAAAR